MLSLIPSFSQIWFFYCGAIYFINFLFSYVGQTSTFQTITYSKWTTENTRAIYEIYLKFAIKTSVYLVFFFLKGCRENFWSINFANEGLSWVNISNISNIIYSRSSITLQQRFCNFLLIAFATHVLKSKHKYSRK